MDVTTQQIAHLMRRAGFSCNSEELARRAAAGLDATVSELINYEGQPETPDLFDPSKRTATSNPPLDLAAIQSFWLYRMIHTTRPLQEKMSLFWHGHFATANYKVMNAPYMLRQYFFLRDHALSDFRTILQGISRDPAMLVWLDNIYNNKRTPNENYAREVMELFSLGVGNYTEADIKAAARAFSGWQIKNGQFWINVQDHDFTNKTFMGVTGRFNGDDIIDVLVSHPATANFMARKLLRFFASENPAQSWVDRIAGVFRQTDGSIKATVEAILRSGEFYEPNEANRTHKSPTEFAVQAVRELGAPASPGTLRTHIRSMGQDLFNPPTVKGWDGGENWVNTSTMLARINFASYLSNMKSGAMSALNLYNGLAAASATTPDAVITFIQNRLSGVNLAAETRSVLAAYLDSSSSGVIGPFKLTQKSVDVKVRNMIRLMVSSPEYQFHWECPSPVAQAMNDVSLDQAA